MGRAEARMAKPGSSKGLYRECAGDQLSTRTQSFTSPAHSRYNTDVFHPAIGHEDAGIEADPAAPSVWSATRRMVQGRGCHAACFDYC